jgi:pimeloyl-ACP methyl ester carboxylesterase
MRRRLVVTHTLHYDVHAGRGPHLLLVHGFLSSRAHWLLNLGALSTVTRPVVVELLGHGRSPTPEDAGAYAPDAYVAMFERIRQSLGGEQWYVCGQSLGAALTLRYALEHPDAVIAQVFTNSASALAGPEWTAAVKAGVEAQAQRLREHGRAAIDEHPLNPARNKRLPTHVREALAADIALHSPEGLARTSLYTVPGSSVRERIAENKVPSLLVVGEREDRFARSRAYAEAHMPHLDVVGLDGGHAVNLDRPEEFNATVVSFLGRWP